jgi:gluconolactonase
MTVPIMRFTDRKFDSAGPRVAWGRGEMFSVLMVLPSMAAQGQSSVIAEDAKVEKLGGGYGFTEGPVADATGNVFFTDQNNNQILKWSAEDNKIEVWLKPAGRSNGMDIDKEGNLIACADEKTELRKIDKDKKVPVLIGTYETKQLNGPNDVWVHPKGGMYLTDPFFRRSWWTYSQMPQDKQCVYYLSPDGKKLTRVIDDFRQPNGIVGTPDGKTLYVADYGGRQTYKYDVQEDGTLTNKTLFCSVGSDGMTIDDEGNLYLTSRGVLVFDKAGKQIERITVPEEPSNVTFGGKDRHLLFITARTSVYGLKMKVKGK